MAPKTRKTQTKKPETPEGEIELLEVEFPGFHFRFPAEGESFLSHRDGELCIFKSHLKAGLTLPLPSFLEVILRHCHLVPAQFTPNALEILKGVQKFMELWEIEWTIPNIFSMVRIATMQEKGMLFVQPRQPGKVSLSGTPRGVHGWKEKYYFVSSDLPWGINTIPKEMDLKIMQQVEITEAVEKLHTGMECIWFDLNVRTGAVKSSIQPRGKEVPSKQKEKQVAPQAAPEGDGDEGDEDEEVAPPKVKDVVYTRGARKRKLVLPDEESEADSKETTEEEEAADEGSPSSSPSKKSAPESQGEAPSGEAAGGEKESKMGFWFDKKNKVFSFRSNLKEGIIPQGEAPSLPLHLLHALLSADDQAYMGTLTDMDLASLQSQLSIGSALVARYISDGSMSRLRGLQEWQEVGASQKAKIAGLEERMEKDGEDFINQKNTLLIEGRQLAEESTTWQKKYEDSIKEREAEEEKRLKEGQEWEKKVALQEERHKLYLKEHHNENNKLREEVERLKAAASAPSSSMSVADAALIYKQSKDFKIEMGGFGDMGFQLLKAALVKDGKMEEKDLDAYNYIRVMARVMKGEL